MHVYTIFTNLGFSFTNNQFLMLFIKSEVLFGIVRSTCQKKINSFCTLYKLLYGTNSFYLNLVHIFVFTLWGFILRFALIGDYTLRNNYWVYFYTLFLVRLSVFVILFFFYL